MGAPQTSKYTFSHVFESLQRRKHTSNRLALSAGSFISILVRWRPSAQDPPDSSHVLQISVPHPIFSIQALRSCVRVVKPQHEVDLASLSPCFPCRPP